ncbi:IS3 family transposase [Streptomyces sp. NBC_00199]|uniref:IS3 family transposase n=1 Tax=Streptomyces sp. NBC_00199 TaxID=2975678 RepID=UPI00338FE8D5
MPAVLKREGTACGRRRIARLMRAAGLAGRQRRRRQRTTIPAARGSTPRPGPARLPARPDRDGRSLARRHHLHPTDEGRLYLTTVIDIASCRAVGWADTAAARGASVRRRTGPEGRERSRDRTVKPGDSSWCSSGRLANHQRRAENDMAVRH